MGDIPPVIAALAIGLIAVEAVLSLGGLRVIGGPGAIGWRAMLVEQVAVTSAVWEAIVQRGFADTRLLLRLVAYPVVHGSPIHALFASAMLLALGKFVAEAMGQGRTVLVLLVGAVAGGATYGAIPGEVYPLFGAYPPVYGLIGAYTYLAWVRIGRMGGNRIGAFRLIGVLMALQLVFGALLGANPTWVAELAGFVGGGLAALLAAPGSLVALRTRLRAR